MRYAYYNPIRAGIVRRAADYRWCWIKTFEAGSVPGCPFAVSWTDGGGGSAPPSDFREKIIHLPIA